jgi:hypothetical protein
VEEFGPCPVFFPSYLINGTIFEKKDIIEYEMLVLILSTAVV